MVMLHRLMLAIAVLAALAIGCKSDSQGQAPPPVEPCGVEGSVETTVSDLSGTYTDVPDTQLVVDPSRQMLDEDLNWNLIEVGGSGFWSITGSLRWTGMIELERVTGVESEIGHSAEVYYQLRTGELGGLVFVPLEREDAEGTITATLSSEYDAGRRRTRYAFGLLPDYVGTSKDVTVGWRYHAATDELVFESV